MAPDRQTGAGHTVDDPAGWSAAALRRGIDLDAAAAAAARCRGCRLWQRATQVVFGSGARRAPLLLVGEQPGDVEDRRGEPFVGPAGRLLDRGLAAAGIARTAVYLTNAVKHFGYESRGKWRIHKKPRPDEVRACRPWLQMELELVAPRVVLALGATAARALGGSGVRVLRDRGRPVEWSAAPALYVTVHPSSLLRAPDEDSRRQGFADFVADLRTAWQQARP